MATNRVELPSDVAPVDNGRVRDELLVGCGVVAHSNPNRELKMHHLHAARAMRAMVKEASLALDLGQVRAVDSYRTLQTQETAFDGTDPAKRGPHTGRYIPEELWSTFGPGQLVNSDVRRWKDKRWKRRADTVESAVPGRSNHGWGLAIDFAGDQIGRLFPWLEQHAARFGFINDNPREKWHWSYRLGDAPPPAFADEDEDPAADEHAHVTDDKDEEDDEMRVIDLAPNTPSFTRLVIAGRVRWVRGHAAPALDRMKITTFEVQRNELSDLMRTFGTEGPSPFNGISRNAAPDPELDAVWEQSRA